MSARPVSEALCSSWSRARYCCWAWGPSSASRGLFRGRPCFWKLGGVEGGHRASGLVDPAGSGPLALQHRLADAVQAVDDHAILKKKTAHTKYLEVMKEGTPVYILSVTRQSRTRRRERKERKPGKKARKEAWKIERKPGKELRKEGKEARQEGKKGGMEDRKEARQGRKERKPGKEGKKEGRKGKIGGMEGRKEARQGGKEVKEGSQAIRQVRKRSQARRQ
ncbi:hypothetical protein EYF80_050284 [Liparis tanakae]|uniref:Uncharacterized protein n=1 Tax=Liparis tanakae TaxID=230148 RepID=A0A4Z2FEB3_9TELE|nr:hypothetical protein EYF80_050284 [Liparis tanakae]